MEDRKCWLVHEKGPEDYAVKAIVEDLPQSGMCRYLYRRRNAMKSCDAICSSKIEKLVQLM